MNAIERVCGGCDETKPCAELADGRWLCRGCLFKLLRSEKKCVCGHGERSHSVLVGYCYAPVNAKRLILCKCRAFADASPKEVSWRDGEGDFAVIDDGRIVQIRRTYADALQAQREWLEFCHDAGTPAVGVHISRLDAGVS